MASTLFPNLSGPTSDSHTIRRAGTAGVRGLYRVMIGCALVLILLLQAGCGGDLRPSSSAPSPAGASSAPSPPTDLVATPTAQVPMSTAATGSPSASATKLDGCTLLRSAGVEATFGKALKDPVPAPGGGVIGSCKWTFDPGDGGLSPASLTLQIFSPPAGFKPADFYSQMRDTIVSFTGTVTEPVPGFGAQSVWEASKAASQFATLTDRGLILFMSGFAVTNLDKVSTLAKRVIDGLPK